MLPAQPLPNAIHISRRSVLAGAAALALPSTATSQITSPNLTKEIRMSEADACWSNRARLMVSISLMFENGGQPLSGAGEVMLHLHVPNEMRAGPVRLNRFPRTISGFLPGSLQIAVFAAA
jgi:hypothetical protein